MKYSRQAGHLGPSRNRSGNCKRWAIVTLIVALSGCGGPASPRSSNPTSSTTSTGTRHGSTLPTTTTTTNDPTVRRRVVLGYSVQHRPITAFEVGDADSPARTLIVGCIHGNEPAGIAIADAAARSDVTAQADLWVIPDLNPDGVAAHTRSNAHGVDLNRNFPYDWQPLGRPGSTYYSGPHALSEPESAIAASLVQRLRPQLTIYYHQHLAVVDDSEGPVSLERRYAHAVGLPLRALTDYPGSAVGWQDELLGPTAFVVELPGGALETSDVRRHLAALFSILPVR